MLALTGQRQYRMLNTHRTERLRDNTETLNTDREI